jgi:hypothetical protein
LALATGDRCLISRDRRLETACQTLGSEPGSLNEGRSHGGLPTTKGTVGVKSLESLDVGPDLDPLALDGGVATDLRSVKGVGLCRGETSCRELGVFHVSIIRQFVEATK